MWMEAAKGDEVSHPDLESQATPYWDPQTGQSSETLMSQNYELQLYQGRDAG